MNSLVKFLVEAFLMFIIALLVSSFVWVVAMLFGVEWLYWETLRIGVICFIVFEIIAAVVRSLSNSTKMDHYGGGTWRPPF